jgi:hypothetical protein
VEPNISATFTFLPVESRSFPKNLTQLFIILGLHKVAWEMPKVERFRRARSSTSSSFGLRGVESIGSSFMRPPPKLTASNKSPAFACNHRADRFRIFRSFLRVFELLESAASDPTHTAGYRCCRRNASYFHGGSSATAAARLHSFIDTHACLLKIVRKSALQISRS